MIVDEIADSHNDEYYTPTYAITPLLKYLSPNAIIWCPFDTEESNFVKVLRADGHSVNPTHISEGFDFFTSENVNCDYIISNPPYSKKSEVLKALFDSSKSFAMLVGVVGLFESQRRFDMFKNNEFEIMYLNRRVAFFKDYKEQKPSISPPFSSVYICRGILPKQIVFEEIVK